ncbi:DMT family transporter [Winogradskyella sp. MH6]|uniref:DMT family transporter n=1 Tax=Winogradskyella sp. MH6 TaxID=2929510 RepID=UPI001FB38B9B|nr:DMT family transporter [Winogradskyella sp. MH6]
MKKAIFYMVISAIAFTLLNVTVKSLGQFSVYQIVFFRALGSLFFTLPFLLKNKISIYGNKKTLLVLRSIFGLSSMLLFFMSLRYITMGTAVSVRYIAPIFASIFAVFLLREKIKLIQWFFLALAFSGVLVLKGFGEDLQIEGIVFSFISAVFAGLVYITIRKIGDKDHPVVVVNYFMLISTVIGGLLSINDWKTPMGYEWLVLMSLGVFGYFAQLYMTKAMQIGETNQITPFKYLEVVFTTIVGLLWFNETYSFYILLGMLIIILGLTLNLIFKKSQ